MEVPKTPHKGVRLTLLFFCFLSFISVTEAFPRQTSQAESSYRADGWTPKPTDAPLLRIELARRQASGDICGYVTGDLADPIRCGVGFTCTSNKSLLGCCDVENCALATACYDFQAAVACSGNCTSAAKFCTESAELYCNTYRFTDNTTFTDYFCSTRGVGELNASKIGRPINEGLSTDAKIGIGIGIGVGVPATSLALLFLCIPGPWNRSKPVFNISGGKAIATGGVATGGVATSNT